MFNESDGIWPRAGITYLRIASSDDDDESESTGSALGLSIEASLLFTPVANGAITFGPTVDYRLSTSSESTDSEGSTTEDEDDNPSHEFGPSRPHGCLAVSRVGPQSRSPEGGRPGRYRNTAAR